jgi:hypothetical protein
LLEHQEKMFMLDAKLTIKDQKQLLRLYLLFFKEIKLLLEVQFLNLIKILKYFSILLIMEHQD